MKKTLFVISVDFENKNFFTPLGGIQSKKISIEKNPVETADFSKDWAFLLENSGVSKVEIECSGVLDPDLPERLFDNLLDANLKGSFLKVKIENDFKSICGLFRVQISFSDSFEDATSFDLKLSSSDEVLFT